MTEPAPLRAPAGDGDILAVPALEQVGPLLETNHTRLVRARSNVLGLPWSDLRSLARRELILAARRYLSERNEPSPSLPTPLHETPIILAGHQPELYHPGVWIKNFALAGLSRRHGAVGVNLIVDNDVVKSTSLSVPARTEDGLRVCRLPFDHWQGETAWEERRALNPHLLARFGEEASELLRPFGYEPILSGLWQEVRHQVQRGAVLGEAFAGARRKLERDWGCRNLEVPLSVVCKGEAFPWFAGAILADLPHFKEVYNAAVRAHRQRHGIRSRHHPVPDLTSEGDWLETPFWGWRGGTPSKGRGRLFARLLPDRIELRAAGEVWPVLPAAQRGPLFLEGWRGLESAGYKVRTRALSTTMLARLLLGDLFLHGIGGGKYDELTDVIIRRFWQVEPPDFLVLSATRHLPLPAPPVSRDDCRRIERLWRDLEYNPDRHLAPADRQRLAALVQEKQAWIDRAPDTPVGRRERFRRLRQLNEQMRPAVLAQQQKLDQECALVKRGLRQRALAQRRDWAFCLYPAGLLRPFFAELL